jgi:hypothetical protein
VNENDAKASIKAWGVGVATERRLAVRTNPLIFPEVGPLAEALQRDEVDAVGLTLVKYFDLEGRVRWGTILAATIGDDITNTYDLLVHRDSGIDRIEDLLGRREACLVNQSGFETLAELNPQVGPDLRPLKISLSGTAETGRKTRSTS